MKEDYLHAVWRLKRIPYQYLCLTDGRRLTIRNPGWHNPDAGPDFFNGSVEIEGLRWNGNIEIHVKSSDWYAHRHHLDQAYNSVILHVVFRHDKEVYIGGQAVPTLELCNLIDFNHWNNYTKLLAAQSWIPCANSFGNVRPVTLVNQLEIALLERLDRKAALNEARFRELNGDALALYYEIYARAFGLKVNELPFVELTRKLDLKLAWKEDGAKIPLLFLGVAGFLGQADRFGLLGLEGEWSYLKRKHGLYEMDFHSWRFKGLRPVSFPDRKVPLFARLCSRPDFFRLHELTYPELKSLFASLESSENFRRHLLINVAVSILWWNYKRFGKETIRETALKILRETAAESNQVVRQWKKLGVKCKSSFETQGLLELKNELCTKKKCLSCKIAYEILKQ